jgi:hypothetical protein
LFYDDASDSRMVDDDGVIAVPMTTDSPDGVLDLGTRRKAFSPSVDERRINDNRHSTTSGLWASSNMAAVAEESDDLQQC